MSLFPICWKNIFLTTILFLLASCANIVTPSGGKKDATPPKPVKSIPPELSTNYNGKKVTVTFDEYFTLNDADNQIYMSPVTNDKPRVTVKKKSLLITLPDSLKQHTTYCINFGSSIMDINEGNKLNDFKYVFSTGVQIDSLMVKGKVENAFDKKTEKGLLVMLFNDLSDSAVVKNKPAYYARTDDKGYFRIEYVKEGKYKLFCLKDQNFNYQYDLPNESIAFVDSAITVKDTSGNYTLELFQPSPSHQHLFSALQGGHGKIIFAFAKPLENFSSVLLNKETKIIVTEFSPTKDTALCWVDKWNADSLFFILRDKNFADTAGVPMQELSKGLKSANMNKLTFRSNLSLMKKEYSIATNTPLKLNFNRPVQSINENRKIVLTEDSSQRKVPVVTLLYTDSVTNKKTIVFTFTSKENTSYHLKVQDSSLYDIYGTPNDSINISFHTTSASDMGALVLNIFQSDSTAAYYVQLISKSGNVADTKQIVPGKNSLKYESLSPGTYFVRAVDDKNRNGKWDVGNYWKRIQPEKVILFQQEITIRANWDVEQSFTIPK